MAEKHIPVEQRDALKKTFTNLCQQYQEMGEQLKVISMLISPYLEGQQELVPEVSFEMPERLPPSTN